jgi:hypothetical protein
MKRGVRGVIRSRLLREPAIIAGLHWGGSVVDCFATQIREAAVL